MPKLYEYHNNKNACHMLVGFIPSTIFSSNNCPQLVISHLGSMHETNVIHTSMVQKSPLNLESQGRYKNLN